MASSNAAPKTDAKLMELSVDRNALLAEVTVAARISETKTTQPILAHLLLEASADGILRISTTDLTRSLKTECPAQVEVAGTAAVPAQQFLDYLKLLPNGPVQFKILANSHLQVNAGSSRTRMPGRAPSEFPKVPTPSGRSIGMSCRVLRTLVRQSLFAVSTGDDRYLLRAALLLLRPDRAGMVATDGHRLSFVVIPEDGIAVESVQKSLIPRECLTDLLALLSATKEERLEFSEDETNLFFRIGTRQLSVRKLVGQFPNYEGVMPTDLPNSTVVRSADLLSSIQRVLEFADARSNGVKIRLAENTLTISSSTPELGESEETLAVSYSNEPITIGFNGSYLVEFLRTIGEKGAMRLSLKDANTAGVLVPESMNLEYQQRYVVMPMRI